MQSSTLQRLAAILKRELGATNVTVLRDTDDSDNPNTLYWDIGHHQKLAVTFDPAPANMSEKRERLATLVESFADLLADVTQEAPAKRPDPAEALKIELNALAGRANAECALIIDAKSPVVWSASDIPTRNDVDPNSHETLVFARAQSLGISWLELLAHEPGTLSAIEKNESNAAPETGRLLRLVPPIDDLAGLSQEDRQFLAQRAELAIDGINRIRKNPILPELHRGVHLHEAVFDDQIGYLARSFATIYVLLLVFPGQFDELGAERAVVRALPTIERLVIALPPDEGPTGHDKGAVVALRRRRK